MARARPVSGWKGALFGVASGGLMALGQAPYDLWPLAFLGCAGAVALCLSTGGRGSAAGLGWAVGLGYFGLTLSWIVEPFLVDAAATGWMAPFGLGGLAGGLALFWAAAFWAASGARHRAAALVIAWTLAELARAYLFTGFPWALLSYLWLPSGAIQWVSLIGPHGLTFVTLALAALLARGGLTRSAPRLAGAAACVALLVGSGLWLAPAGQALSDRPLVRLIQPNAAQHEKWDPALMPVFFERQIGLTAAATDPPPALVIWPETALPMLLHRADAARRQISEAAGPVPVVFGIQRGEGTDFFNSLVHMGGDGALRQIYDKHHLVPFGEYMPAAGLFSRWNIAGLAARADGGYTAGPGPRLLDFGPLGTALPLICYEAVFPQDVNAAPERPDFLLQITNDAWFGTFSGPYQHLAQARIRAIEQGLPLLRSANTGVSAVIDPAGRILASLPLGEAGRLDAPLPRPLAPTLYSRSGDLPVFLLALVAALWLGWRNRRSDFD